MLLERKPSFEMSVRLRFDSKYSVVLFYTSITPDFIMTVDKHMFKK